MNDRRFTRTATILLGLLAVAAAPAPRGPVIDMHLHASRIRAPERIAVCPGDQVTDWPAVDPGLRGTDYWPVTCSHPLLSAVSSEKLRDETIAAMRAYNVRRGLLAGDAALVADWASRAPGLFIPASAPRHHSEEELEILRQLRAAGKIAAIAELGTQYSGIRADHASLDRFWALAEQLDLPVGIHLGEGVPGQAHDRKDRYRVSITSPFQLEEVLLKHPRLRLWVMHAASPLTDEMIAMLFEFPQLYVDVGANVWNMPRAQFYAQLKQLVDAGFSRRILFGSDQTLFPDAIGHSIRSIERAPFLTGRQKRDILYNNAARFLRLTPEQIAADHR